jgi:hypothetical protein
LAEKTAAPIHHTLSGTRKKLTLTLLRRRDEKAC